MFLPKKFIGAKLNIEPAIKNHQFFSDNNVENWTFKDFLRTAKIQSLEHVKEKLHEYKISLNSLLNKQALTDEIKAYIGTMIDKKYTDRELRELMNVLKEFKIQIINSTLKKSVVGNNTSVIIVNKGKDKRKADINEDDNRRNTGAKSEVSVPYKQKRKATEMEESSELNIPVVPSDGSDALDNLFKNPLPTPIPSLAPSEFRRLVYHYGSKALSKILNMADVVVLENFIQVFKPTTLGEQLDIMSAKLAIAIDLSKIMEVNALKLSLSRIVDTVNNNVTSVYRQYLSDQFWKSIVDVDIDLNEGMSASAKQLYRKIIINGTVNDKIDKRELRIAIAEEKLSMLISNQTECLQILDILDIITKNCLTDRSNRSDDDASELTCYRKFAKILDEMLDNTMLDIRDGERVSKASKTAATNLEKNYSTNIPLNNGFGRRVDLILSSNDIELSTSEWKRKRCPVAKCLQQQAKNIRINKAILRYFLDLPISEDSKNNIMTVGMDWTGTVGYMFAVKPLDDVFIARKLYTLATPTYIDELPSFIDTLDHLYSWRNYHTYIKDIVLEALGKREKENFFSSLLGSSTVITANDDASPNIYLTPTRSRRRRTDTESGDEE